MYHNIIVPLDGSELAERVLSHVAELIRGRSSQVHLLSIAPRGSPATVDVRVATTATDTPEAWSRLERNLIEYLRSAAAPLESVAADVWLGVRVGRSADEILAFAHEVGADLIAMSTHGRSGISRWVFGSVADRVLRGATCPVLLVRAGQPQHRTPYRCILIPLDGSATAEQIVPYVKEIIAPPAPSTSDLEDSVIARRDPPRVFLLSVLTTGLADRTVTLLTSYPPGLQLATTALQHAEVQLQSYLRSVAAALREYGVAVHIAIRQGSPADEILTCAADIDADLIGMTTHGFSGASRWVYGSVAGRVLQGAHCPVLLVRPQFKQGDN